MAIPDNAVGAVEKQRQYNRNNTTFACQESKGIWAEHVRRAPMPQQRGAF
ncbi:hypothetical protein [Bradyrhizobium liaoningense]|nr:hypothetical protein [Bradyrhizobium liaoningense]MBR0901357.1 hypothetical protein [Bradyrhizobium liaoningense]